MEEPQVRLENMSDHDLLIRVATLLEVVIKGHNNHLEHHRRRDIAMLTVTMGAIFTSMIAIGSAVFAVIVN